MNLFNTLYINGKFLVQRTTGVQRFARGLVSALDGLLTLQQDLPSPVLLTPPGAEMLQLQKIEQRTCGKVGASATLWEQSSLPWAARNGTLLCLSGSAPLFGRARIPTIHDAAIYLHPKAYSWRFNAWYRLLFRVVTAASPIAFSVSTTAARELERFLPGRKFLVIPNAAEHILKVSADINFLTKKKLQAKKYLLAVGSRNPTKNMNALVSAYIESGLGPDISLVLVGGGNDKVFANGSSSAAVPGIIYMGAINDAALRSLYENALAFVFPSIYEGFGIPPLEAMNCGCPVVASNISSIPEVCHDAAMYFDPFDKKSIVAALQAITSDSELRNTLIKRGQDRVFEYSWSRSASILLDNLQAIGLLTPPTFPSLQSHSRH